MTVGRVWIPFPNDPGSNRYLQPLPRAALVKELLNRLEKLPNVQKAAVGSGNDVPFQGNLRTLIRFSFLGESADQRERVAEFGSVSPGYFAALQTPIKRGRAFTAFDAGTARRVAVVNEAFARSFSPDRDPLGRTLRNRTGPEYLIVGIVGNVRDEGLDVPPEPRVYASIYQSPSFALALILRTSADAASLQTELARTVHDIDPELPVHGVRTMDDIMSASMARRRFSVLLMTLFAAVALALAAIGVYGVVAFLVGQRLHEFGIRLALGAQPRDILALACRPGLTLAAGGIAVGLAASVATTRLMSALLFGVTAHDSLTYVTVPVLLGIVAVVACVIPARVATRLSPVEALK